jgi:hypothetical protein
MYVRVKVRLSYTDGTGFQVVEKAFDVPWDPKNTGEFVRMLTGSQKKELDAWVAQYSKDHPSTYWELQT